MPPPQGTLSALPVSQRLNPPCSQDGTRFDPTFEGTGWGHKALLAHRRLDDSSGRLDGKRTFSAAPVGVETALKSTLPSISVQEKPTLRATRFHKGFQRQRVEKQPPTMAREALALKPPDVTDCSVRRDQRDKVRREYLIGQDSRSGCNLVTGGAPITGTSRAFVPDKPIIKPKGKIDHETGVIVKGEMKQLKHTAMAERRKARLQMDGLAPEKRSWTVKEQLHCYDGFVVPNDMYRTLAQPDFKFGRRPQPRFPSNNFVLPTSAEDS
eukprot:TRINITY_DN17996_c0_g1_i1.p1 TRINITY_DN17996_c0_g1~~TRINITY_DN17996_c0_g1_i1.p1  ORF type:complete len:268 (+),score=86.54 TRINITY_DN17996_c0_g1_i1:54-857(+)